MSNDFFRPKSIAIIGASAKPEKIGFLLVKNLLDGGFGGKIYPINYNESNILGLKTYPSIKNVTDSVEMAIIAIPAEGVKECLSECVKNKVKYAVIISAGFSEIGGAGVYRQTEITEIAKKGNIRILGPNCLGIISPANRLNASFSLNMPTRKNIGVISQSGATCTSILDWANKKGIGFSHFVSMGNKVDLNENDFLSFFTDDQTTEVVLGYLESITDGERFLSLTRELTAEKPFILLKSGVSLEGQEAARSHTAALATDDLVLDEAFSEVGITRAKHLGDLFEWSMVFSEIKLPKKNKVLVITNAGGPAVMATDAIAAAEHLSFFEFGTKQKKYLKDRLADRIKIANPLDLQGDATSKEFRTALEALNREQKPDLKIVLLTPQADTDITEIAKTIVDKKDNKTVVVMIGGKSFEEANSVLAEAKVPTFLYPESAVTALNELAKYALYKNKDTTGQPYIKGIKKAAEKIVDKKIDLNDADIAKLLAAYHIPMADSKLTTNANDAIKVAQAIGYPVVLKVTSPDILHKTEVGAVKLAVKNDDDLRESFQDILRNAKYHYPKAKILGVTVYKMFRSSVEVALGAKRDPVFGPFVMFGLGGIYIEILKDFKIHLAAVSIDEAMEMIGGIKSFALLNGYRNGEKYDLKSLAVAISGLSAMIRDFPEISEIDINPLCFDKKTKKVMALDAKVIFDRPKFS